jgi:UDP-glucose:(heptosyl)LPS alpha-1,3-glucosyltransferase
LRLAVVSPFVDRRHGTERALAELLERLAHKEHCEIHLYSQRVEGLALTQVSPPKANQSGAIIWHRVPSLPGPQLLQFLAWLFLNSIHRVWDRSANGLHFDLVLSPGINCLDADVIIVHALFHRLQELASKEKRETARTGFLRSLHRRVYYGLLAALERHIYSDLNVMLAAVSRRTATCLRNYFNRQDACVIPNAVDAARFSVSARLALRAQARSRRHFLESDFVLLLMGNDWRVKGLETVLHAMGSLRERPIQIVVAGDDSPRLFLEIVRSLGISERCRFEPSRDDVLDFYAAADLYVSPSHEDSFALPVAEAMACGLPVITSAQAGVSEWIRQGENGFVVGDPYDREELSRLLADLYRDPAKRQRVGDSASKFPPEWNWDHNATAVWKLLQGAVHRKSAASGSDS